MKKFSVIVLIFILSEAHAANQNWHGVYVGANSGFMFNQAKFTAQHAGFTSPNESCNVQANFSTLSSGFELGFLQQLSNVLVSGIEASVNFHTNQKYNLNCNSNFNPSVYDRSVFTNQNEISLKARLGILQNGHNNILPYLTAGASFANTDISYVNEGGNYYAGSKHTAGLLLGAGVEWAFIEHWSLRAEYNYVDYGNAIKLNIPSVYGLYDPNGKSNVNLNSNNLSVAINYWL